MGTTAATTTSRTNPWVFGPVVDLLVGCGAWSLPLIGLTYFLSQRDAVHLSFAFYFLGVFCNQPHYMATVYRAYHTKTDFNQYRFFTIYVTVFILLTAVVVHLAPALFPWLLTFYLTWSPWHYSGQNFGISMMLIRRAGAQPTEQQRNLIWWSYLASYAVWFLALHNSGTAQQPNLLILPIPENYARLAELFFVLVYLVAGFAGHAPLVRRVGLRALAGPLTLFTTQFLWLLLPEVMRVTTSLVMPATYSSAGILAFMHCAQYLWITSYFARKERSTGAPGAQPGNVSFWPYYLILVVGGIALFIPGPWVASRVFGYDLVESFFIFAALINLHHFILDGAIWKLRDGRIARLLLGRNPPAPEPDLAGAPVKERSRWAWFAGPSLGARGLRWSLVVLLLGLALVDQAQFWLTLKTAGQPALLLARQFNPQDTRTYFQRAKQLIAEGKPDEAMAELRRAIAINPRNNPAQHLLGELLFKSGDARAALDHYDRMAQLFGPDHVVLVNSGLLAAKLGNTAKAVECLDAALQLSPNETSLHLYLGQVLESSGDLPGALREYALFVQLHAGDLTAPEVLPDYLAAGLKLAELSLKQAKPDDARRLYQRVAALARAHGQASYAELAEENLRAMQSAR
ncbi:MAG TPA: tetratricopeptide repeat protein [Candidatus Didemnitutus sp.]|nr:tetratricopeptide repeat protein [Candidatus Didemnitutus sp.]